MTHDLATTLLCDPDPMVRRAAAEDLGEGGRSSSRSCVVIEALVGALRDPHIGVQRSAANALGGILTKSRLRTNPPAVAWERSTSKYRRRYPSENWIRGGPLPASGH